MRARLPLLLLVLLVAGALVVGPALIGPAQAATKPVKVKAGASITVACPNPAATALAGTATWYDKAGVSLGTSAGRPSGSSVTFGPAPKRTELAAVTLDCLVIRFIDGTLTIPTDGEPRILFGLAPITPACEPDETMDFARSTVTAPQDVTVEPFPDIGWIIVTGPFIDPEQTRQISFHVACTRP